MAPFEAYISSDDKALVPLGIPAAVKQQKILMCMENPTKLAEHNFTYAPGHKLRPSVDSICEVVPGLPGRQDAIRYVGPTFVNIRSTLHNVGSAAKHYED